MKNKIRNFSLALAMLAIVPGYSSYKTEPQQGKASGYNQGHEIQKHQMMSAYNSSARYDVEGAWDFFLNASFIWWKPMQQGMALGTTGNTNPGASIDSIVNMRFKYKPGFKVGLGMYCDHDNWDLSANYTWLYANTTKRYTAAIDGTNNYLPYWFDQNSQNNTISLQHSKWNLKFNDIALELGRCFYVGTKLVFRSHYGLKINFIKQKMSTDINYVLQGTLTTPKSSALQKSWAIGPRVGCDMKYLLGAGFRFFGSPTFALLYQDFSKIRFNQDTPTTPTTKLHNAKNSERQLTSNPTANIGFGWGSYFGDNKWHFDIALGYDFEAFLNQNQMAKLVSAHTNIYNDMFGDLFLHGYTLSVRFDF